MKTEIEDCIMLSRKKSFELRKLKVAVETEWCCEHEFEKSVRRKWLKLFEEIACSFRGGFISPAAPGIIHTGIEPKLRFRF